MNCLDVQKKDKDTLRKAIHRIGKENRGNDMLSNRKETSRTAKARQCGDAEMPRTAKARALH